MKVFIHEIVRSPATWLIIVAHGAAIATIVFLAVLVQRESEHRKMDKAMERMVVQMKEQVRNEVASLRAADEKSGVDREKINRNVEKINRNVDKIKEVVKEAIKDGDKIPWQR